MRQNLYSIARGALLLLLSLAAGSTATAQRYQTLEPFYVMDLGEITLEERFSGSETRSPRQRPLREYSPIEPFYVMGLGEITLPAEIATYECRPLRLALKSNLLFDLATAINLELEIPIGESFSLAGEMIFPWWTMDNHKADSRRNRLQLVNGTLEGRYWWGDRRERATLTGWFSGLYCGLGTYDVEHNARGYQGDLIFTTGLSGGYAHAINQRGNLRLEYSIGVGYMTTYYHYYEAEFCNNSYWHAVEKRSGRLKWFGPARAKVSLSWLFEFNNK